MIYYRSKFVPVIYILKIYYRQQIFPPWDPFIYGLCIVKLTYVTQAVIQINNKYAHFKLNEPCISPK